MIINKRKIAINVIEEKTNNKITKSNKKKNKK